jgi:hypothetical protein
VGLSLSSRHFLRIDFPEAEIRLRTRSQAYELHPSAGCELHPSAGRVSFWLLADQDPLSGVQNPGAVWSPISPSSGRERLRIIGALLCTRGLKAPDESAMRHSVDSHPLAQAVTVAGRPAVRL